MRRTWDIPGGVHPPENKIQSNQHPIAQIALPDELVLPVNQHMGSPAIPVVKEGDKVLKGQVIAEAQGIVSASVHASSSGTVTALEDRAIPHASGLSAPCIVITTDKQDQWCELTPCEDYTALETIDLVEKVRKAGIAGLGGAGFPTAVKLSPRANQKINTLILNGAECEPYITADDLLMRERASEIIKGIELLSFMLHNPQDIFVGIEDNKPEAIAAMKNAAVGSAVEIISFPTKYPSGGEKQLIQILTGKELPSGTLPSQIGIVVQNVGTAVSAYRAVRYGEPLISRITTVVGESLSVQQNTEVLIGTPISHILEQHHFDPKNCARLIIGGPMMGYSVDRTDIPVVKTTNCILVPSPFEMPEPSLAQACIRCGMCAEVCPASLLPQQLYWHALAEDVDKLNTYNLFDCIECGACSYVCPSNIPLVQYYRASKGAIRKIESEKQKSDRSRQRFEFRQERLAKAELIKEEKRLARKEAAERARSQLAKKNNGNLPKSDSNAQKHDNETQRGRLERAVSAAESRAQSIESQLKICQQEGESPRVAALQSSLKQAQLKHSEAISKLKQLDSDTRSTADPNAQTKLSLCDREKIAKTIETLKKRIATAEEKYAQAKNNNSTHADALKTGVEKLRIKLRDAENEYDRVGPISADKTIEDGKKALTAAEIAIQKAKLKIAASASMSADEKAKLALTSLKQRLEKARERLKKAELEKSEHIEAFRSSVLKLEMKVQESETQ